MKKVVWVALGCAWSSVAIGAECQYQGRVAPYVRCIAAQAWEALSRVMEVEDRVTALEGDYTTAA